MNYSVAIRTLGKAGEKYKKTLNSIVSQTIKPDSILIYLAEGYEIPPETCGLEKYVYVKKGMVAQRALQYDEVDSEYILFLDDDVYLPPDAVEKMFNALNDNKIDVIAANTFDNHKHGLKTKIFHALTGKMIPLNSDKWAFKVLLSGGTAYNSNPKHDFYLSQTNAGPCFLCRKEDFLKINFDEEKWLDETPYALPEDQVMFYKMYRKGLKMGTLFNSGIVHLDAGTTVATDSERENKVLYSEIRNHIIFWHRFIKPYNKGIKLIIAHITLGYYKTMRRVFALKSKICGNYEQWKTINKAIRDANDSTYIKSK